MQLVFGIWDLSFGICHLSFGIWYLGFGIYPEGYMFDELIDRQMRLLDGLQKLGDYL
jgi:hypothetical protein